MQYIIVALLLISQSLLFGESKAIHALIIGTPGLHSAHVNDAIWMQNCLHDLSSQANIELKATLLQNEKITAENVACWIDALPQNSQDAVLVYYSGNSAAGSQKKAHWPSMTYYKQQKKALGMSEDAILQMIRMKNPRLAFVFFDCYSQIVKFPKIDFCFSFSDMPTSQIKKLFADSVGYVMYASSKSGKVSIGVESRSKQIGGLHTTNLIRILYAYQNRYISWEQIFVKLKEDANVQFHASPSAKFKASVYIPGQKDYHPLYVQE